MRRAGRRGEDRWERVEWEEALDTIAERYRRILEEDGNEAFLSFGGTGNWSTLSTGVRGLYSAFWNRFGGTTPIISQLCCASVTEGLQRRLRRRAVRVPRRVGAQPVLPGLGQQPGRLQPGLHEEPVPGPRGARRAAGDDRSAAERDGRPLGSVDPGPAGHGRGARPGQWSGCCSTRSCSTTTTCAPSPTRRSWCATASAATTCRQAAAALAGGRQRAAGGPAGAAAPDERRQRPRELRGLGDERAGRPVPADTPGVRPALRGSYEIDGVRCQPVFEWLRGRRGALYARLSSSASRARRQTSWPR